MSEQDHRDHRGGAALLFGVSLVAGATGFVLGARLNQPVVADKLRKRPLTAKLPRQPLAAEKLQQPVAEEKFLLSDMGPQSEYTHVQFLGFNLLTIPGHDVDGCSHPETGLEGCYLGSEDIQQDVERRIEIMTTAMQSAYAEWKRNKLVGRGWTSEPQVKTLKFFVVPEFFWRGSRGVYSFEEVWDGTLPIVDRLREAAADSKFEDWLFFFGTIVMSKPTKGWFGSSELAYKNVMPIMKGLRMRDN